MHSALHEQQLVHDVNCEQCLDLSKCVLAGTPLYPPNMNALLYIGATTAWRGFTLCSTFDHLDHQRNLERIWGALT